MQSFFVEPRDLCLVAHKDEPWGVEVNFDSWTITRVDRNKQFNKLGIQVGNKILRVDGVPVIFDRSKYKAMLTGGAECNLTISAIVKVTHEIFLSRLISLKQSQ